MNVSSFTGKCAATLATVVMALAAPNAELHAQSDRADSVKHRNDCRLAEQVLVHGQPANRRNWALSTFVICTEAGRIAVQMLQQAVADSPAQLDEIVSAVSSLRDPDLALAAADLATDPSASTTVRVQALRILYSQAVPGFAIPYAGIISSQVIVDSSASSVTSETWPPDQFVTHIPVFGAQLPRTVVEAISARLEALMNDSRAPRDVRVAAERAEGAMSALLVVMTTCPTGTPIHVCLERLRDRGCGPDATM